MDGVVVVISAFNEAQTIRQVVNEVRQVCPQVVVVDDGSSDETPSLARAAGATVLRHVINRGQGAALQTGITYALAAGARYVITFDADGQHQGGDLERLLEPVMSGGVEIAIGSRFLNNADSVPWFRRVVLRIAVVFTRIFSGARLTDAHNGLRALSRKAAGTLNIRLDRMAHASELIDQIVQSGLPYVEVPVHIRYTEYSKAKGQRSLAAFRVALDYLIGKLLG